MKSSPNEVRDRRLVGYLRRCGDDECPCIEPIIEEVWLQRTHHTIVPIHKDEAPAAIEMWEERSETVWVGTFQADPASYDIEFASDELTGACERHKMERDGFEKDRWEREL